MEYKGKKKYLEKGLSKLYKAAEADEDDRLSEALSLYIKGTGHLYNSLQYDDHTDLEKKNLHANYLQYLSRIESIEQLLEDQKRKKKESKKEKKRDKKKASKFHQQNSSFEDEFDYKEASTPQMSRHTPTTPSTTRHANMLVPPSPRSPTHPSINVVPPTLPRDPRSLPPPSPQRDPVNHEHVPQQPPPVTRKKSPPPVPTTPRPSLTGSLTLDRRRDPTAKQPLRASPSVPIAEVNPYTANAAAQHKRPIMHSNSSNDLHNRIHPANLQSRTLPKGSISPYKQVVQVHRAPEYHTTGTLKRIHDTYMSRDSGNNILRRQGSKEKPFSNLDVDTLIANAVTIIAMATKEDLMGNYKDALQKYEDAVKLMFYIIREYQTISNETRESIRSKGVLYQERIETIKAMISNISPCQQKSYRDTGEVKIEEEYREAITTQKPNIMMSSVAGQDEAKDLLTSTILSPIKFPTMFSEKSGRLTRNVLLYGPPGSGKTYLAKAIACEAHNASYFYVKACDLVSKYLSDAKRLIQVLFEKAREHRPSVVIIDDLEYLQYSDNQSDVFKFEKQELVFQIRAPDNYGVFIISITNAPWNLDTSVRNCFDKTVALTLPDLPARIQILNMNLKQISHSINEKELVQLAHQTERFSGADLNSLVHDALMQPVFRLQAATHFKQVRSESHMDGAYVPCSPNEVDAVAMTLEELTTKDLKDPCLSYGDVKLSLASFGCSVSQADLLKFEEYGDNNR